MNATKNGTANGEPAVLQERFAKRPRPSWRNSAIMDKDSARPERKRGHINEAPQLLTDRGSRQAMERPRPSRRSHFIMDEDTARLQRKRDDIDELLQLLPFWGSRQAMERTQPKNPEAVAEPKYEPTDDERVVLAKQAQRLKDQVRAPRMKFVEDVRGGRLEFDHPNQAIAAALLNEAFGTPDGQFTKGLIGYLCTVLLTDENSRFDHPRAEDLNCAISLIAVGKPVDEFNAQMLADAAVCQIIVERLLHHVSQPLKFDLSDELKQSLTFYKYNPLGKLDRDVKIDNRSVLEFSVRHATRLMKTRLELIAAANRYWASVELSRKTQPLSAATLAEAGLGEIKHSYARPKKAKAGRARKLNGSAGHKRLQKADSTGARKANGRAPA